MHCERTKRQQVTDAFKDRSLHNQVEVKRHDKTTNPMGEELGKLSESNQHARLVSLELDPLIAPSHVVAAAETSHEAAAAETAAHG